MDHTHLLELATNALYDHCYDAAIFYANKLVTVEPLNPQYALMLAHAYYNTAQYRRVIRVLEEFLPRSLLSNGVQMPRHCDPQSAMVIDYLKCLHLAGKSHLRLNQSQDCVELLQNFDIAVDTDWKEDTKVIVERAYGLRPSRETKISALLCLLRAEALESLDVRSSAITWYKNALRYDVTCVEAWKKLSEGFMLQPAEEAALLASLTFPPHLDWLHALYTCKSSNFMANYNVDILPAAPQTAPQSAPKKLPSPVLAPAPTKPLPTPSIASKASEPTPLSTSSKPHQPSSDTGNVELPAPPKKYGLELVTKLDTTYGLSKNADLIAAKAQAAFYGNDIREAFKLTSAALERDPYCLEVMSTHLSCLVELGMKNELYLLAHRMAESAPKSALSWYAVGCYYFLIRSWQNARLYFGKATALNREFGAGWLAYGYTFSQNGDHDQALSAYRTAARLLVGSHLPVLLIAVELMRTKDLLLAKTFALKAQEMHPLDPYPMHELAVIHFRNQEYEKAIELFENVFTLIGKANIDETWEPTIFNLAQAHIKLKQYTKAITLLEWSLALVPYNVSTYASLAFAHHVCGHLTEAIDCYHHVLTISPEDAFSLQALEDALDEWVLGQVDQHRQAATASLDALISEPLPELPPLDAPTEGSW